MESCATITATLISTYSDMVHYNYFKIKIRNAVGRSKYETFAHPQYDKLDTD